MVLGLSIAQIVPYHSEESSKPNGLERKGVPYRHFKVKSRCRATTFP